MTRLTIVAPGLLGPWPAPHGRFVCEQLEAPALALMLSRGDVQRQAPGADADAGIERDLAELFGLPFADPAFPSAPLTALADGLAVLPGECMLRADPVSLVAEPHGAQVRFGVDLALTLDDARELAGDLSAELARGWRLEVPVAERWYVRLDRLPSLDTTPPHGVFGPAVEPALPRGADGREWRALLTEAQMLLFAHPLNALRERAAQPLVNSLWIWGQGALPQTPSVAAAEVVCSSEPLACGLGRWSGAQVVVRSPGAGAWLSAAHAGHTVLVLDDCAGLAARGDVEGWRERLTTLERNWFAPLLEALRDGRIGTVVVRTGAGSVRHFSRMMARRFWRRVRPLEEFVAHG